MLGKLSMIGAVAAIIMIPHSAVRPSRGRFPRVDDSTALSACVELRQALPTKPTTQNLRRCALKASDSKDRVAGPQRSGIRMDVSDRCAPGKMRSRASTSPAQERVSAEPSKG